MAGKLSEVNMGDFSKGENTAVSPYLAGPKQALQMVNFILDEHGSARVRDGTLVQTSSPTSEAGRPIIALYDFIKVDGTVIKLAVLAGVAGNNTLYNRGTSPWTKIADLSSAATIPQFQTFTNLAIVSNGYDTLRSYDGTTLANLTGAPGGQHTAVHLGFLWAWNTAAATTATDGPSSLRSSDLNNPNSWITANQTFVAKDDGQQGQGLGLFTIAETGISPTATMVAFKDYSAYQVSGVFGSSAFAVQKTKSDMGCVAPRSIQFLSGFGIVRLTHRGFALYDGVNDLLISEEERPRLFGRDDFTGLDWNNIGRSWATQVPNPPLYLCACPVGGKPLTRVFIYDLIRKAWTVATFANDVSSMYLSTIPGSLPMVLLGDFANNGVRRAFAGDSDDDGAAIKWLLRTRPVFDGSASDRVYFRRAIVKEFGMAQASSVTAKFIFGPTNFTTQKTILVNQIVSSFAGYGVDVYGQTGYGSVGVKSVTDVDLNFDIGVIANNCLVELTGSGAGRIRGIAWHLRKKALTRSTIAA